MTAALSLLPGAAVVGTGAGLVEAVLASLLPEPGLRDGDVVVVPGTLVSRAEGRVVGARPGTAWKDAAVAAEAVRVLRRSGQHGPAIVETRQGFVCADAGVVAVPDEGVALLLPLDPDRSARRLRAGLQARTGAPLAVVVTGAFDDAWRRGHRAVALGCAGLAGSAGSAGRLGAAMADELAAAARLALGARHATPDGVCVVVRGLDRAWFGTGSVAADVIRPAGEQRFR